VAKKKPTLKTWFDNCGGWFPKHDLAALRDGLKAGFLDEQDKYGMTALHLAVASAWLEGVAQLLRAGADTELRHFRDGATALLTAVQDACTAGAHENSDAIVAALVAAGANPDAGNHFGLTPRKWSTTVAGRRTFARVRKKPVEMPEPRIQDAEHLADHYHPRFKIPEREERETFQVGVAVDLYVYGPQRKGKQDTVKVRITARRGRRPNVRYIAAVETPLEQTHLPAGTAEVEFGPENVATVYVPRPPRKKATRKR
jgi:ankyrin repeat protein